MSGGYSVPARCALHAERRAERKTVPVVSRFFGIVIAMFWRDHVPPHFHAKYGDDEVTVDIHTGEVTGQIARRALALVEEWRVEHKAELLEDWSLAASKRPLKRITPLE
jgi:hypothetical protein